MDFDAAAAGWDTEKRLKRARAISDEIAKAVEIKPHSNALEFGCGTGLVSFGLKDSFDHITLVDTSVGMINELSNKIKESGITNMTALNADIPSLPESSPYIAQTALPQGKYDVVYSSMVLHHVADVRSAIKKLYGFISVGGTICIVDLTADDGSFHRLEKDFSGHNGFDEDELKVVLKNAGFVNIHSRVFYKDFKKIEDRDVPYSLFIMIGSKPQEVNK
ncbi:MAG TPA: class I SAM-dependent methyltransferase [Clostridia bacterium]|nr:class I SAM-dependent methyltransferase [Clostridia bacterium]